MKYISTIGIAFLLNINSLIGQCDPPLPFELQSVVNEIVIDDQGTPEQCSDDTYTATVTISVTGSGNTLFWGIIADDGTFQLTGRYNEEVDLQPFPLYLPNGTLNTQQVVIRDLSANPGCLSTINLTPPIPTGCACEILAQAEAIDILPGMASDLCNDDQVLLGITANRIGAGSGETWNYIINTEDETPGGTYNTTTSIGTYNIFGGDQFLQSFSIVVTDSNDENCNTSFTYLPPAPTEDCECNVQFDYELGSINNNGTSSNCDDDFSELIFTDISSDINGDYEILVDNEQVFTGEFGDEGGMVQIPIDGNIHRLTMRSLTDFACLAVYDLPIIHSACPIEPMEFSFGESNICSQTSFCLPIHVNSFTDILGMQFSINYDPTALAFTGSQSFNAELYGWTVASIGNPAAGSLTVTWNDPFAQGVSLTPDELLVEICFERLFNENFSTPVNFSSNPIPIEIVNGFEQHVPLVSTNANLSCSCLLTITDPLVTVDNNDTPLNIEDDSFFFEVVIVNSEDGSSTWTIEDQSENLFSGNYGVSSIIGPYACNDMTEFSFTITDDDDTSCTTYFSVDNPLLGCNSNPLIMSFPDTEACQTDAFCVPLTVNGFDNILSFQFSISYDPAALEYTGSTLFNPVLVGFTQGSIGILDPGILTVTWNDPFAMGQSLIAGDTLLSFCFNSLGNEGVTTELSITNTPTSIRVIDGDEMNVNVFTIPAEITCECTISAGTINLSTDVLCSGVSLEWAYNDDANLPPDYVLGVALYTEEDDLPSQYLAFTDDITMPQPETAEPNRTYYLRTIAGPSDGSGGIDFAADCIDRGEITPITWSEVIVENCITTTITCIAPFATLECTVTGGIGELTYAWTFNDVTISTFPTVSVSAPGPYFFTATDENGCTDEQEIFVVDETDPPSLLTNTSGNLCEDGGVVISADSNLPMAIFSWSTGENGESITVVSPGEYSVTVIDTENGCTNVATVVIDEIPEECNIIQGIAYRSGDCLINETPLANWLVEVSGDDYLQYQYTNSLGEYEVYVPQGAFQVRLLPISPAWEACEEEGYDLLFPGNGETQIQDFRATPLSDCPLLQVSMNVGLLRPCFTDRILTVAYENVGTETLLDEGLIAVILPPDLSYSSTTGTYLGSNGDTLFFAPTQPLLPGEYDQFIVRVDVSCEAVLGSTLCVQALGLPYGPCPAPMVEWSGGSLQVSGECTTDEVVFTLRNVGNATLSTGNNYIVIQDGVMLWEVPEEVPPLLPGESTTVSLPANGLTYQLEAEQEPFHPGFSNPLVAIEGCGVNGDGTFSTGFVIQLPNNEEDVYIDEDCRVVTASYDPNDKQAEPLGYATEHYIEPGRSLEYTIHFQNTGTDTAFIVTIRDTLSDWLDMTTLRPGVSSHPYQLELDTARAMSFIFDDILLPDSTTNFDASEGFVEFKVRPLLETPLGTRIENTAAIYFDFNEPIITNTAYHTLGLDFLDVINWVNTAIIDTDWRVFPNPTAGQLQVTWASSTKQAFLLITDPLGRQRGRFSLQGGNVTLDMQFLPPGWYGLQLIGENGNLLGSGKLIRR